MPVLPRIRALVSRAIVPLELILPHGVSRSSVVVGSNCPPRLCSPSGSPDGPADLAVLAPSEAELLEGEWLRSSATTLMTRLDTDGVLYVLAPPRVRPRLRKILQAAGAAVIRSVLHYTDWSRGQYLVPLDGGPGRYAVRQLMALPRVKAAVADRALQLPWVISLLRDHHPGVAMAAQRSGARPLGDWLAQSQGYSQWTGGVLVKSKWRNEEGTAVVFSIDPKGSLRGVAKLALDPRHGAGRAERESAALLRLAPAVRSSGAVVPEVRVVSTGPGTLLLESAIDGLPAAELFRLHRESFPRMLARITDWLEQWNRKTVKTRIAEPEWLEAQLLQPAAALAALRERPAYLAWLRQRCAALAGHPVPVVAAHNDLTMSNLLVTIDGQLGVLDWEAAGERMPLADFFYAAADAASAEDHYADRVKGFQRCFEAGGPWRQLIGDSEERIRRATNASSQVAALSFHGCWVQHAAAEAAKRAPGEPRPFLRIVERIADQCLRNGKLD